MNDVASDRAHDNDAWQVTWANQRWTRDIFWLVDVDESSVDMWHASVGCKGATWPNHRLPRGTPVFFYWFWLLIKSLYSSPDLNR
jgi:hypothetical protein